MRKTKVVRKRGSRKVIPVERDSNGRKVPSNAVLSLATRAGFLAVLESGLSWQAACAEVDKAKSTMYRLYRNDEEFRAQCDEAIETGKEGLEDEAVRRGKKGVRRAIYYQGEVVGHQQEYSDQLLIRTLEARRPETWGRKQVSVDATIKSTNVIVSMTFDELKEEARRRGLPVELFGS